MTITAIYGGLLIYKHCHYPRQHTLGQEISTFGGILCAIGVLTQSRKALRDDFKPSVTSQSVEQLDDRSAKWGLIWLMIGTAVWAVGGYLIE